MATPQIFHRALEFVIKWEGEGLNRFDPDDLGGATHTGVTQPPLDEYCRQKRIPRISVQNLTKEQIEDFYRTMYWDGHCEGLDDAMAIAFFDCAVNMGVSRAKSFLRQTKDLKEYLDLREAKYHEFAQRGNQRKYLRGWINRLDDLWSYCLQFESAKGGKATLQILKHTILKRQPVQSFKLKSSDKVAIPAGTELPLLAYLEEGNHIKVTLDGKSFNGYNTWWCYKADSKIKPVGVT